MKLYIKLCKFYVLFHHQTQELCYRIKTTKTSSFNWSWGKTKQNRAETNSVGKEGEMNLQRVRGGCKFDQNTYETLQELIKILHNSFFEIFIYTCNIA